MTIVDVPIDVMSNKNHLRSEKCDSPNTILHDILSHNVLEDDQQYNPLENRYEIRLRDDK